MMNIYFISSLVSRLLPWEHPYLLNYRSGSNQYAHGFNAWFRLPTSFVAFHSLNALLKKGFTSQLQLGLFPLLCGYISIHLITAQKEYYLELGSRRTAHRWGTNLISHLWNFVYQIWWHRNNILRQHDQISIVCGLSLLCDSIQAEHNNGLQYLPNVYRRYFNTALPILLSKSTLYLKRWFLMIRSARESFNPSNISDIWTTDNSLRRWIGLPPSHQV